MPKVAKMTCIDCLLMSRPVGRIMATVESAQTSFATHSAMFSFVLQADHAKSCVSGVLKCQKSKLPA